MLKVSTFNIQNDYGKDLTKNKQIIDYIISNKIDIIGVQELFKQTAKDLENKLKKENYHITGFYRYKLPFLKKYNEKNAIITNKDIIDTKTYYLPFIPSFTKRVLTKTIIKYNEKLVSIYNTHLECKIISVKQKQLNKIISIIGKDPNNIILLGDFNLKTNKDMFNKFTDDLEKLGIYRVPINDKTLKTSKYHRAIDHIFLSSNFKVIKKEIVTKVKTSDHYPVLLSLIDEK